VNEKITDTKTRLQYLMDTRRLKQVDIQKKCEPYCKKFGVKMNKSDLSQYVSGKVEPSQYKLMVLGMALNVSEAWLMGFDVPMERQNKKINNIFSIKTKKVPLLGEIACGNPILADEKHDYFIDVSIDSDVDFCLKCKGDSMINARILDGDIVFIHKQDIVDNGEIAAVIIDNEATLKRVNYKPDKNMLILKAENPKYDDFVYVGEELEDIKILGKAVAFQSNIK